MTNELKDFLRQSAFMPGILLMLLGGIGIGQLLDSQWPIVCFIFGIMLLVWAAMYRVRLHIDAALYRVRLHLALSEHLASLESQKEDSSASCAQGISAHADSLVRIDRILTIILGSKTGEETETDLIREFGFSEIQAREILNMRPPSPWPPPFFAPQWSNKWVEGREGERKGPAAPPSGRLLR